MQKEKHNGSTNKYTQKYPEFQVHARKKCEIIETKVQAYGETQVQKILKVDARPFKRLQGLCPKCKKKRSLNGIKQKQESHWRAPNLNGIPVYICYRPHRILCPEHGAINEYIPWADGTSRFTPESDVKSPPSKFNFTELLNLNEKSFIILIMRAYFLFYCLFPFQL